MDRPNVLILYSDQHNARCLSCAGHPDVQTPNLDRLAAEGLRFDNAYANNPICTPSRISFLSGLYPSTHGYYGLYGPPPAAPMTSLFRHFRAHGYRTGALGKLHTPRYWIESDCQFVYDEFIEHPKYLEGAGYYERNDNRAFTGPRDGERSELPLAHSCELALAKQAVRFLRNEGEPRDRGDAAAPWLAWVSFSRPHQPYTPSSPFAEMYTAASVTLPPTSPEEKPEIRKKREGIGEGELRRIVAAYLGLVSQVDHAIGSILEELERSGQLERTIIVYTADHGDYAGEHGLYEKSGGLSYRAITCVPLIVRLPGGGRPAAAAERSGGEAAGGSAAPDVPAAAGSPASPASSRPPVPPGRAAAEPHTAPASGGYPRCAELIEAVDVFPTLCELAGVPVPHTVQGVSFAGLLNGAKLGANAGRSAAARAASGSATGRGRTSALTENAYRKAIATASWRYVANLRGEQPDELYNLDDDPWELRNRIGDPACAEIAAELLRELLDRTVRARKPVNAINGMWHGHRYDEDGRIDLHLSGGTNPYW